MADVGNVQGSSSVAGSGLSGSGRSDALDSAISCESIFRAFAPTRKGTKPLVVLSDINLTVKRGEFLVIVGPSGCGKSTLLNIMAGTDKASRGSIKIGEGLDRRAYVFQRETLLPWRTALNNVELGLLASGKTKGQRREEARNWLAAVGLKGFEDSYPAKLSGGMRRRVVLATAFAHGPQVLFMDEPFGAVDAQTRLQLQIQLLGLWEQDRKTVVFVTHDIEEALLLGDRIVVMSGRPGRIADIHEVSLARPRSIENVRFDATLAGVAREIWLQLRQDEEQNEK
ncbi:MAG TPA: ABC transporter ATP-binding protein [Acidimicrobiales bacterium]|nr:ABC transporter ATP-binding protein [Acidimicrobiales bacterium]